MCPAQQAASPGHDRCPLGTAADATVLIPAAEAGLGYSGGTWTWAQLKLVNRQTLFPKDGD